MRKILLVVMASLFATVASAQTPTVSYDYLLQASETLPMVQSWTAVLYVNGSAFTAAHTCIAQPPPGPPPAPANALTCTFPLPNVASAITATGPQSFEVALRDAIVGEGAKAIPFIRVKPHAPTNSRTP